ncbi:MAG TPA: hypothetical protein PKY12_08650, partial [Catalimonadaceae bacterium]|nr:hypothetical protein [Catalimonadaceae bacterium]
KDATMGSENFDPLFVERFNEAGDKTTLRINVGDDGGNDKVEFGYYNDNSGWQQSAAVYANGEIWAREVNVVNYGTPYPDFVFKSGYKLPDLFEIENFIKKEGHLPNIPTEKEVGEKGINLGEMNKLLLQKIEEMTLHLIRMQKEIDELKKL